MGNNKRIRQRCTAIIAAYNAKGITEYERPMLQTVNAIASAAKHGDPESPATEGLLRQYEHDLCIKPPREATHSSPAYHKARYDDEG